MTTVRTVVSLLIALALAACSRPEPNQSVPIHIVATDSGFVLPDTLHEGLNHILFENRGSAIHECMFVRLPDGMSGAQYAEAVRADYPFPEGAIDCSGPGLTSPSQRVELWLPLEAGRYFLACWFGEHLTQLEPRTVVVHGAPRVVVTPPREDAVLTLSDFRFELTGRIRLGTQTIRVETIGPSMHEVDVFRLQGGRRLDDLKAWYGGNQAGPPPATLLGGVLDSHVLPHVVWLRRDFTVGRYVFWCGMPMVQSGKKPDDPAAAAASHSDAGMVMEFDVTM